METNIALYCLKYNNSISLSVIMFLTLHSHSACKVQRVAIKQPWTTTELDREPTINLE